MAIHTVEEAVKLFWTGRYNEFAEYIREAPKRCLKWILLAVMNAWDLANWRLPEKDRVEFISTAVELSLKFAKGIRGWKKK